MSLLIVLLDGSERVDRGTTQLLADADIVIDATGAVLKSKDGSSPTRINLPEFRKVLSTQARPRKAQEGGAAP